MDVRHPRGPDLVHHFMDVSHSICPTGQNLTGTLSVFCFLLVGPQGIYLHASIRLNFNMKGFSFAILGAFCGLLTGIIVKNKGEMPQSCSLFLS